MHIWTWDLRKLPPFCPQHDLHVSPCVLSVRMPPNKCSHHLLSAVLS